MSAINIEVTKNVYDVDLQQEVTTYDVTLEKGYYPLPSNVDLSNYYTKQEVIDNFKPISYNPNIDEVITNGNTTSQSIIFQNSFGGSDWKNEVSSLFNVFKKINPTTSEVEETTYGQQGFTSTSSSGYTAINFAPKTKDATIIFPNESGTVVLDYQLDGLGNPFDYVQLNTSATNTYGVGKVYWNEAKGTYNFGLLNNVELQLGQEQHVYGKAYSAISNGQLVMYRTSQGGHIIFEPADFAQLSTNPDLLIGVATQDIDLNAFGYITTFGEVNTLNTSSFADGDTLYFGSTNVLQNTIPSGIYFIIGRVNRSHATQGSIFVKPYFNNLSTKQDVLTPENVGEFMDLDLPIKLTPMADDTILARDVLTNEAVEIPFSSLQKAQKVITITGNTTLSETHNGAVLNVTNTCNITIPTGLDANFQCVIFAKGSVIVTFVNGGVTIYAPSGLLLKTDKMASLISTAANNFNLTGELATS